MSVREKLVQMKQLVSEEARESSRIARLELAHQATRLEVNPAGDNRQWYGVLISVEGPEEVLRDVRYVEYFLHPTFVPNRVRRNNPPHFELRLKVWGEFTLRAEANFSTGPAVPLALYLRLPR